MADAADVCECCGSQIEPACYCPLTGVITVLSRKYAMQLINVLGAHGAMRFSDLVEAGLVTRTEYNEIPPRVEYELTQDGQELRTLLAPVLEWVTHRE